jgi:hypothetical protein
VEISEQQDCNGNVNPTKMLDSQSQLENPHPACSPQKHSNSSVAGNESGLARKAPQEQTKQVSKHQKKYAKYTTKMSKYRNTSVSALKAGLLNPSTQSRALSALWM